MQREEWLKFQSDSMKRLPNASTSTERRELTTVILMAEVVERLYQLQPKVKTADDPPAGAAEPGTKKSS